MIFTMDQKEEENTTSGKKSKKIACKHCGGHLTYIRLKDKSLVCRSCGHIEPLEELGETDG